MKDTFTNTCTIVLRFTAVASLPHASLGTLRVA